MDELNLLEANLLDLVLNVLDAGTNRVEREGLSTQHACASLPPPSLPQRSPCSHSCFRRDMRAWITNPSAGKRQHTQTSTHAQPKTTACQAQPQGPFRSQGHTA